jgi:hypothetical protein
VANFPVSQYKQSGQNIAQDLQKVLQTSFIGNISGEAFYSESGEKTADTISAVECNLLSFYVSNENAAARYLWIFNSPTANATSTANVMGIFPIAAGSATNPSSLTLDRKILGENGVYLKKGLSFGLSSSKVAYLNTGMTASDHVVFSTFLQRNSN